MRKNIGIDVGAKNTRVMISDRGVTITEPTAVAISPADGHVMCFGLRATRLDARTPGNVEINYPISMGKVPDEKLLEGILTCVTEHLPGKKEKFDVAISVSGANDEMYDQIVIDAARAAGAKSVYVVDSLTAAAYGADADLFSNFMLIDLGASSVDIAVFSGGEIVDSRMLGVAGNMYDRAIREYVSSKYGVIVSDEAAEEIKISIGSLNPESRRSGEIPAVNPEFGVPCMIELKSSDLVPVFERLFDELVQNVKDMLKDAKDVEKIILTGGMAQFDGLCEGLAELTGVPCEISASPMCGVVNGIGYMFMNGDFD